METNCTIYCDQPIRVALIFMLHQKHYTNTDLQKLKRKLES